jgi:hypothetical protein
MYAVVLLLLSPRRWLSNRSIRLQNQNYSPAMTDRQLLWRGQWITTFLRLLFSLFWFCPRPVGGVGWLSAILLLAQLLSIPTVLRLLSFPSASPPSCRCSDLSPTTIPARFALLDPTSLRWGGWIVGSRLYCHPTLRQGSVTQNRALALLLTSAG